MAREVVGKFVSEEHRLGGDLCRCADERAVTQCLKKSERGINPLSFIFRSNARDLRGQRPGLPIRVPPQRRHLERPPEIRVERDLQLEGVIVVLVQLVGSRADLEAGAEVKVAAQQQQPQVGIIACLALAERAVTFLISF